MPTPTVEERLTILEKEMTEIKQRLETEHAFPIPAGWEQIFGIFADDPLFEEAVRLGREWRETQNALSEEEEDASA